MRYTQVNSKVGFWLRRLGIKFLAFTRALCTHNGRSLQAKNLRRLLAKIPTFEFTCVWLVVILWLCLTSFVPKESRYVVQTPEDQERARFFSSLDQGKSDQRPVGEIPQIFHVIWLGHEPIAPQALSLMRTWIDHHPGWRMILWMDHTKAACVDMPWLQSRFVEDFPLQELEDYYYRAQSFEERSLLLRYAILAHMGGVYVDSNVQCLACIEKLRASHDFFCGLEVPGSSMRSSWVNPSCHLLASTAQHPIIISAKEWIAANWQAFDELLAGSDGSSIENRMLHRCMNALSFGIEHAACQEGRKDAVFSPDFFSLFEPGSARYIQSHSAYAVIQPKALFGRRIEQEKNKEDMQAALEQIRQKLRISLILIVALALINLLLAIFLFQLYRKRKNR